MRVITNRFTRIDEVAAWLEEIMLKHEILELVIIPGGGMLATVYDCVVIFKEKTR